MENLVYIKLKHSLKDNDLEKKIIEFINLKVKTLPDYVQLKLHPEMVLLVANLIENAVVDRKIKINKKELLIRVLSTIFNYTEADKKNVVDVLEFLHANKSIKRVSFFKKCLAITIDWLKRKFL